MDVYINPKINKVRTEIMCKTIVKHFNKTFQFNMGKYYTLEKQ